MKNFLRLTLLFLLLLAATSAFATLTGTENFESVKGPSTFNGGFPLYLGPALYTGGEPLTASIFSPGTVYGSIGPVPRQGGGYDIVCPGCSNYMGIDFLEKMTTIDFDILHPDTSFYHGRAGQYVLIAYDQNGNPISTQFLTVPPPPSVTRAHVAVAGMYGVTISPPEIPFVAGQDESGQDIIVTTFEFAIDNVSYSSASPLRIATAAGVGPANAGTPRKDVTTHDAPDNPITYPLGLPFFLQLEAKQQDGTWKTVPASISIQDGDVDFLHNLEIGLFREHNLWFYGSPAASDYKDFQTVHQGDAVLTLQPTDTSIDRVDLILHIVRPDSLGPRGGPGSDFDQDFINAAEESGIPPQYLKAQSMQETAEHPFNPRTWRYEALSVDYPLMHKKSLIGQMPWSDYILREATRPEGTKLCPVTAFASGGFAHDCRFAGIDDLKARTEGPPYLNFTRNNSTTRILDTSGLLQPITIREIYNGSWNYYNFDGSDPSPQCGPVKNPQPGGPTASGRRRAVNHPTGPCPGDLLNVTAQTPSASSYGVMQVVHTFALGDNASTGTSDWGGVNVAPGDDRYNPSLLFDDQPSRANFGSSIVPGTTEDVRDYREQNLRAPNDVSFANQNEFSGDQGELWWMFKAYNGCSCYPPKVFGYVSNFLPRTSIPPTTTGSGSCTPPSIVNQTQSLSLVGGNVANLGFSLAAGARAGSIQWYEGSDTSRPIPNADLAWITVSPTVTTVYWAQVRNSCGTAQTNPILVTIRNGCSVVPTITAQPANQTTDADGNATLSVAAANAISYQWYLGQGPAVPGVDGDRRNPVPGGTTAQITVHPLQTTSYWVAVTNICGSSLSNSATVTVVAPPPSCTPSSITSQPSNAAVTTPASTTLTVGAAGTAPLTITWFTSAGTPVGTGSSLTVAPSATTSYYARVSNACGSVDSAVATVTVNGTPACVAPSITSQPAGITIIAGGSAQMTVAAGGTAPLTVQWFLGDGTPAGSGASITVSPAVTTGYFAQVTNACGTATSALATVTVTPCSAPVVTQQPAPSTTVSSGGRVTLFVIANGTPPLTVQWFIIPTGSSTGTKIDGATTPQLVLNPTASATYYAVYTNACGTGRSQNAVVTVHALCVAPAVTQNPVASVTITAGDTVTLQAQGSGTDLVYEWYDEFGSPLGPGAVVSFRPAVTRSYYCNISNSCGSVNTTSSVVTVNAACNAPDITGDPISTTIAAGNSATLWVFAAGVDLSFQWYTSDGSPVLGGTAQSLTVSPAQTTSYYAVATNICGSARSGTATVTVMP
jgi:hypothetical protein